MKHRNYRQIIKYHSALGHIYVPHLTARMKYGTGAYTITTDENGFRNSALVDGKVNILILGDSYAAGSGVSNEVRFGDYLMRNYDCKVINLAVNGYGLDQQLMVYEMYRDKIPHDLVLLAPHMDDLYRNMLSSRVGVNRDGSDISIPKPYFEMVEDALALRNVPVPIQRDLKKTEPRIDAKRGASRINALKNKIKYSINRNVGRNIVGRVSYPEINDPSSQNWLLANLLLERLKKASFDKQLAILPIPYNYVVENNEPQYYMPYWKQHEGEQVRVLDIHKSMVKSYKESTEMFLPLCGHFTSDTHQLVGEFLAKKLELERRKLSLDSVKDHSPKFLGISCYYHDAAATIVDADGRIIASAQEERFTRVKHDSSFPRNAIHYCLEEAGCDIHDLKGICYYDDESWTIERVLQNVSGLSTAAAEKLWGMSAETLYDKTRLKTNLENNFGYIGEVYKTQHHHSHAASAFYPSPYDEAAILVVDGVGEWACTSIGYGKHSEIKMLEQQNYPHSIGLLYSAVTYFCGFKVNSGEYKLMGLAPYGQPKYQEVFKEKVLKIFDDGSIELNLDLFDFQKGGAMTNDKFAELFGGAPRKGESDITQREMNIAASIQVITEEIIIRIANHAKKITKSDNLVLAGGVALNCVANGKLLREKVFKNVWIQPAAGDAGGALGAALDVCYQTQKDTLSSKKESIQGHVYFGPSFSESEIEAFLQTVDAENHAFNSDTRSKNIASWLSDGKVIGYFDGRMEFGPRALGHRSIIADPTSSEMQKKLNLKIKFRESFRPFAPICLEEDVTTLFNIDRPSPYMLLVAEVADKIKEEVTQIETENLLEIVNQVRSKLPAITHVDFSARIQTMGQENGNPRLFEVLKEFKKKKGYGVLVNTSFNVRGEPIVCTPQDAYACFMRTEMDILVLGDRYLLKEEQKEWKETKNWEEIFQLD